MLENLDEIIESLIKFTFISALIGIAFVFVAVFTGNAKYTGDIMIIALALGAMIGVGKKLV